MYLKSCPRASYHYGTQNEESSKCSAYKVTGSDPRLHPKKTWNEVIRSDLKERKVSPFYKHVIMLSIKWDDLSRNLPLFDDSASDDFQIQVFRHDSRSIVWLMQIFMKFSRN